METLRQEVKVTVLNWGQVAQGATFDVAMFAALTGCQAAAGFSRDQLLGLA
eukprot:NODE_11824_length_248_cov_62.391960_g10054_i0.p3 GENE.NODE_11824_length_248_cov_62.391960_g10054_i0~~NODE_11824_length_248_cov_62.391960_g10054_i0.p3  ORF type:complete len:51 (+),score=9.53 NODE_11824_length_248_cov_62.391960_g10054_i0:57-209(+)